MQESDLFIHALVYVKILRFQVREILIAWFMRNGFVPVNAISYHIASFISYREEQLAKFEDDTSPEIMVSYFPFLRLPPCCSNSNASTNV